MEINTREDKKIVEVWLTNAEQEDAGVKARLNLLFAKYKENGYTVVVFKSGKKGLVSVYRASAAAQSHGRSCCTEKP